jgi:hypothetical protein
MNDELLTTAEVAKVLRISASSVAKWRYNGGGPAYLRVGPAKKIVYRKSDVMEFLERVRTVPTETLDAESQVRHDRISAIVSKYHEQARQAGTLIE